MNIYEYKRKKLQWYNRVINFFLILILSIAISVYFTLIFVELGLDHFEGRGDALTDVAVDLVVDSAQEFFSGFALENMIASQVEEKTGDAINTENVCSSLGEFELDDPELMSMLERKCAEGGIIDYETMFADAMEQQFSEFKGTFRTEFKKNYDESLGKARLFLDYMYTMLPFLKVGYFTLILVGLLLLFFWNNDLVITVNYVGKKMIMIGIFIVLIPYIVFKSNLLVMPFEKVDLSSMLGEDMELPIDPNEIIGKGVEAVSEELAVFYEKFVYASIVILVIGLALWLGNRYYLLPRFAKRLADKTAEEAGVKKPEKEEKKEEAKKEEKKEKKKKETPKKKKDSSKKTKKK